MGRCPHFVPTFTANEQRPFRSNSGVRVIPVVNEVVWILVGFITFPVQGLLLLTAVDWRAGPCRLLGQARRDLQTVPGRWHLSRPPR